MSLISCPDCGTEVSEFAKKCPNCSCPIYKLKSNITAPSNVEPISHTSQIVKEKRNNSMQYLVFGTIVVLFLSYQLHFKEKWLGARNSSSKNSEQVESNSNSNIEATTPSWNCSICGNKIYNSGYEEVSNGVWKRCQEPNQCLICSPNCGKKHTAKMNSYINGSSSTGKIYDPDLCSLCKGTGIEKNNGSLTNEYGRVCPMCDGKGRRSY